MDMIQNLRLGLEMVQYLRHFIGRPYIWGGNNPLEGFDCSGLACEGLRRVGVVGPYEDLSAHALMQKILPTAKVFEGEFHPGTLLFFGKMDRIRHVAVATTKGFMIEAGGGSSSTTTMDKAKSRNAFVRERPIHFRKDLYIALFPDFEGADAGSTETQA